jgi:thiol-disulfide isomerase/thioredoxin
MPFLSFSRDWRLLATSAIPGDPQARVDTNRAEAEITVWEFTDRPVAKETRGRPNPRAAAGPGQAPGGAEADKRSAAARAWEGLKKEVEAAETDAAGKVAAGKTDDERRAVREGRVASLERSVARALDLAREHPRDPAAAAALEFALRYTAAGGASVKLGEQGGEAVALVRRDHLQSRSLGRLVPWVARQGTEASEAVLAAALEQHPQRGTRGRAAYWLATTLAERAEMAAALRRLPDLAVGAPPGHAGRLRATDPEQTSRRAGDLLERLRKDYADVQQDDLRKSGPTTLGEAAGRALFALRTLAVGKVAPEIAGKDLDGKPLKLSDSRGKVVVLVFCGYWCGPCRAMVPHERAPVKRLEGKPFALFWVNSDKDRVLTKERMDKDGANWRSWWDGPEGPIAERWGVQGWPTVYLLDRQGVICYKGGGDPGEALDRAVDTLLKEMEAEKKPRN